MFCKNLSLVPVLVLSLVASGLAFTGPRDTATVKLVEKVMPSVVSVNNKEDGNIELMGTGFIVDDRGYVLTCNHVVDGMTAVAVGFSDGAYLPAEVVWKDAEADQALLRVRGQHAFPEVRLGPADLKLGETVTAIGNPFGLERSVTRGIVSKIDDVIFEGKTFKQAIQTDAAINPGNSGGPVFNAEGEVVGIGFLKLRAGDNIAWAINADVAMRKLASKCSAKEIAGVEHGLVVEEKVLSRDGADRRAVLVRRTVEKGPADKAGLKRGDRILKVTIKDDGKDVERAITSRFDLERSFWKCQPGDEVRLTVVRDGKELQVSLKLEGSGVEREDD